MQLPAHLKKYIVRQEDHQYSFIEQSTWRYILAHLKDFLSSHAHAYYVEGLQKTGITLDRIPQIKDIAKCLKPLGWTALPVSGFIPPAAFMELQSLGVLPIATEMRSFEHLYYTPAPDIVHEAAGHAPMLAHPEYSDYLKSYAKVSRMALLSKEDLAIYRAIRILSDLKENPNATEVQIKKATDELNDAQARVTEPSEAALLARMNWWTAEYGLIGDLSDPKIYGAGLLSSIGESKSCFSPSVKKIPLSLDCVNYPYDITEPQPQLFVTPNFGYLKTVLNEFAQSMAFKTGGIKALQKGIACGTVTSTQLDSGIEIGGILQSFKRDNEGHIAFVKWLGPCQLAFEEKELPGHGPSYHSHGFSTAIGYLENSDVAPHDWSQEQWSHYGINVNSNVTLKFISGLKVTGLLMSRLHKNGKTILLTLKDAKMVYQNEVLFEPSWGFLDLALGTRVTSVWGGAPDREKFPEHDDFESIKVPPKILDEKAKKRDQFFQKIHYHRIGLPQFTSLEDVKIFKNEYYLHFSVDPLFDWEMTQIQNSLDI